jgi:secreted trypsin-like serine protease
MKKFLLILPLVFLAACANNNDNGGGGGTPTNPTDPNDGDEVVMVEISHLANDAVRSYTMTETLEFDEKTNPDPVYNEEKVFRVTNSSDVAVAFTMTQIGDGATAFPIVANECGATLAAESSCDVRIQFDGAAHPNGEVHGAIIFSSTDGGILNPAASENEVSLPLMGSLAVSGNDLEDDANDDGETTIGLVISAVFDQGSAAVQTVTITNTGDDPAEDFMVSVTGDYTIFANSCPAHLEEGESCTVEVLYNDYQDLDINEPSAGTLRASSSRSDTYVLSLTGGDVTEE